MEDLNDLSPQIWQSLQHILDYDEDDFEDVFSLMFEIWVENNDGQVENMKLDFCRKDMEVTKENRYNDCI